MWGCQLVAKFPGQAHPQGQDGLAGFKTLNISQPGDNPETTPALSGFISISRENAPDLPRP